MGFCFGFVPDDPWEITNSWCWLQGYYFYNASELSFVSRYNAKVGCSVEGKGWLITFSKATDESLEEEARWAMIAKDPLYLRLMGYAR